MSQKRCEFSDLLVEHCAHCRPKRPVDPWDEPSTLGPWFTSSYSGECADCGERFEMFDRIRADGEGGYLAQCCGGES